MYLRDTLRLPAKGLRPSAHPFFINLLAARPQKAPCRAEVAQAKASLHFKAFGSVADVV